MHLKRREERETPKKNLGFRNILNDFTQDFFCIRSYNWSFIGKIINYHNGPDVYTGVPKNDKSQYLKNLNIRNAMRHT